MSFDGDLAAALLRGSLAGALSRCLWHRVLQAWAPFSPGGSALCTDSCGAEGRKRSGSSLCEQACWSSLFVEFLEAACLVAWRCIIRVLPCAVLR